HDEIEVPYVVRCRVGPGARVWVMYRRGRESIDPRKGAAPCNARFSQRIRYLRLTDGLACDRDTAPESVPGKLAVAWSCGGKPSCDVAPPHAALDRWALSPSGSASPLANVKVRSAWSKDASS